ncbi:unknown [Brachyspira sp. CAG:484]|nr:unknown [Brachyspira sp. CAG:484]
MNNTINAVSFNGNMAKAYLQKKASQQAKIAAEKTKEAARFLINSNQKASKAREYVGTGAYFGVVPSSPRAIGQQKALDSVIASKSIIPASVSAKQAEKAEAVEPMFNFFG